MSREGAEPGPGGRSPAGASSRPPPPPLDPEALLCVLVLAPDTWSRNRFFRVFEEMRARRARRRAALVRSVVATLRAREGDLGEVLPESDDPGAEEPGEVEISFHVPSLGLTRRTRLSQLELALVRYVLGCGSEAGRQRDRERVERSLGKLAPIGFQPSTPPSGGRADRPEG